jgi:4-hydroxy-tetrahydrodipicolinate synthase
MADLSKYKALRGIIAYPITPFREGVIDDDALRDVTENLLRSKPAAIAFLGSTGESAYLSEEEWSHVASTGIKAVAGRVPVIAGIAELTTAAAVAKARKAEALGADMLMVIPISYWRLTDDEIFDHFAAVAAASSLPVMIYNNPATSGVDMSPALMVRMVRELQTVVSIKESSGDLNRMHAIRALSDGGIPFYNGANHIALEALAAGAAGWCTAAPNLLDGQPKRLCELMAAGDVEQARALFYDILPLLRFIVTGGLPTTIKAGLSMRGLDAGVPRLPLKPLPESDRKTLETYLAGLTVAPIQELAAA